MTESRSRQPKALSELSKNERERLLQATRAGVSRRTILGWLGAAGIGSAAGGALLASATKAVANTPSYGGQLRVAGHSSSAKDTLDPAKFTLSTDYIRGHTHYNALTYLDENAAAQPELAESFEPGADASEWIFKLRKGVEFHDGKTLDSQDVVYSILRHKDEAVGSAANGLAQQISSVVADGPDTVRVKLEAPNADLPVLLGTFHFVITQDGTTDFSKGIGTGPYSVKEFAPGVRSVSVRNPNYFKEGRPYLDEIEFFGIADNVARVNALISGDVHAITNLDPASYADIEANDALNVFSTPSPRFSHLIMKTDQAPTDNKDLRLAIKWLLDRERFVKTYGKGYGQIANDHLIPPSHPLYNSDLPQRQVDHDKAKYHLQKAGLAGGKLELHVSDAASGSVEMGLMLQREAARAGLTIDLKREPSDGYWGNIWRKRAFHGGVWNARPTFDMLLSIGWTSDASWNETGWQSPQLDGLIAEGRRTIDPAKRKQIYGDIQRMIYNDGGNAIPAFLDYVDGVSSKVQGLTPVPVGNLSGFNFADKVWLQS